MANQKNSKKIAKSILQVILLSMIICVLIYGTYYLVKFIIKPSDVFIIEESTISETENLTRIYNKRRNTNRK